jgi:hypothetical protein
MRINDRAEFASSGKVDWIPIISTLAGLKTIIKNLYISRFSPKGTENKPMEATPANLKGRVQFWSEQKRAKIALVPVFGNAAIIWHDCRVNLMLNRLEKELRAAPDNRVESIFNEFPEEVKKNETVMLELVKVQPEILKYSPLRNDPKFMLEAAKNNPNDLKYASELMKDEGFVLDTADKIYKDSWVSHIVTQSQKDRSPTAYKGPGYLNILEYAPDLCKKEDFILKAKSKPYLDPIKHAAPHFSQNKEFILKMMSNYRIRDSWPIFPASDKIVPGSVVPTAPLEGIASKELKDDFEFIKKAMEIDPASWQCSSPKVQEAIFKDKDLLGKYGDNRSLMIEAIKRDLKNVGYVKAPLTENETFKRFIHENCPNAIWDQLYKKP